MTPEMVGKARANARKAGYDNVEFRLGEIEPLPIADDTADVIISTGVDHLSPDKPPSTGEAYRGAGSPGARLAVSDVVATAELPAEWRADMQLLSACVSGASTVKDVEGMLREAGLWTSTSAPRKTAGSSSANGSRHQARRLRASRPA